MPADYALVMLEIGRRGELDRTDWLLQSAMAYQLARKRYPDAAIGICIAGYDDDPREVWEIPETRSYICRFADAAGIRSPADCPSIGDIDTYLVGLLAACGVFGDKVTVRMRPC